MTILWRNARLATMAGTSPYGLIERGALLVDGDALDWVGPESALPRALAKMVEEEHDLGGALVTPGLIDCHTHLVYGGQRAREFELRLNGASYEEIARAGGGIRSTVAATRAASDDALYLAAAQRLATLEREGVTTIEIKSGYGLTRDDEARMLRVARRLGEQPSPGRPKTVAGPLGGRARSDRGPTFTRAATVRTTLVDAVDAFCERIGFTPAQTRRVFAAARELHLPVKLHAEQLSDQHGAALAAEFGALSCDHLEYLGDDGVQAMAAAGSVAVLLPGAYYFLRETRLPPVQALRDAGVPIAIASDHNPGSSPALSLLLMINMACTLFRLTPEEALRGVTQHAARALGLASTRGTLETAKRADFAVWALEHPNELAYWFGHNPCRRVVCGGVEVAHE
ncbi:MAG: imidazolonepropionase [Betaproteobacteria bacterium]|nr:MAG: imidazolonepropionase [Betaproteobacteria bacterium]